MFRIVRPCRSWRVRAVRRGTKQPARGKSADQKAKAIAAAKAQGKQVFEGTIRIMNHAELVGFQGVPESNPDYSGTFKYEEYAILVFDGPQTVTGMSGDGTGMQTDSAKLLCVGAYYASVDSVDTTPEWVPYNGKRVVVAGPAEDVGWPSDASLPLGEPRGGGDTEIAVQRIFDGGDWVKSLIRKPAIGALKVRGADLPCKNCF